MGDTDIKKIITTDDLETQRLKLFGSDTSV